MMNFREKAHVSKHTLRLLRRASCWLSEKGKKVLARAIILISYSSISFNSSFCHKKSSADKLSTGEEMNGHLTGFFPF
jgi:hypothetical protein